LRKARQGLAAAWARLFVGTEIRGALPGDGADQSMGRDSSLIAFLVRNEVALQDRRKESDAGVLS